MRIRYKIGKTVYGNCWILGAIFFLLNHRKINEILIRRNHRRDSPHIMFELKGGNIIHYRLLNRKIGLLLTEMELEIFRKKHLKKAIYRSIWRKNDL